MKSGNPDSGFHEEQVAKTLDTAGPDPSKNQGGNVIVEDGPFWDGADIADTLDVSSLVKGQMMPEKRRFPVVVTNDSKAQSSDDGVALPLTQSAGGSGRQAVVYDARADAQYKEVGDQAATLRANEDRALHQMVVGVDWAGDENDVTVAIVHENKEGNLAEAETARALRAGASHSYQAVTVYDGAQVTSKTNRSQPQEGDPSHPVHTSVAQSIVVYENHVQDSRITESEDVSPTLHSKMGTGGNNVPLVEAVDARNLVVDGGVTPTLQAKDKGYSLNYQPVVIQHSTIGRKDEAGAQGSGVREDGATWTLDGRGDPDVIAFQTEGSGQEATEDGTTPTLLSGGDPDNPDHHGARRTMALAFMGGQGAKAGSIAASEEVSPTLKSADSGTNQVPSVLAKSTIRRFTPVETELLQGFPRGWTALIGSKRHRLAADELEYYRKQLEISYGREVTDEEVHRVVSDSHRYRQCGNAVAVPVVAWIGRRLVKVHRSPSPELKAEDLLPHFLMGGQMSLWE